MGVCYCPAEKDNPRARTSNLLPENIRDPFQSLSIPAGEFAAETNTTGRSDVREFTVGFTSSNSLATHASSPGLVFLRDSKAQKRTVSRAWPLVVEESLSARGIIVSHDSVGQWPFKFGRSSPSDPAIKLAVAPSSTPTFTSTDKPATLPFERLGNYPCLISLVKAIRDRARSLPLFSVRVPDHFFHTATQVSAVS